MVDILILNYNDFQSTKEFLENVKNMKCVHGILVVDNNSTDASYKNLLEYENDKIAIIQTQSNGGYGKGNNVGIRYLMEHSDAEHILLANPDTTIDDATINKLEAFLRNHQDFAIIAPFMCNKDGIKEFSTAFRIPKCLEYILSLDLLISKYGHSIYYDDIFDISSEYREVGSVAGSLFLMDKKKMYKYGMYDEKIFLYCEEIVLGMKMKRATMKVGLLCNESFIHMHSVSITKTFSSIIKRRKLLLESMLYVIREYYNVKGIFYLLALLLAKISVLELRLILCIKKFMSTE